MKTKIMNNIFYKKKTTTRISKLTHQDLLSYIDKLNGK